MDDYFAPGLLFPLRTCTRETAFSLKQHFARCNSSNNYNNNNLNLFTHGGLSVSHFSKGRVKL